jgi:hypothetical protein
LPGKAKTAIFLNSMPLVDFWKSSPDQIRSKTIEQLLTFAGDGKLRDGNVTSAEFRQFLGHIPSDLLSTYAAQCLTSSFHDSGFALQDTVNQAGRRLGFKVEDGRSTGTSVGVLSSASVRPRVNTDFRPAGVPRPEHRVAGVLDEMAKVGVMGYASASGGSVARTGSRCFFDSLRDCFHNEGRRMESKN